jgi:hypothetical protein
MRTRYDKTFRYRALRKAEFGNSVSTAQNVWTNIHNPVTEHMIRTVHSEPIEDTFEDTLYYLDSLASKDRSTSMGDVIKFHNEIKETLYAQNLTTGDTLLEFAVGRGNDLHKWRKQKLSKVVGIDLFESNLNAPGQGACVRYLKAKQDQKADPMPPVLFIPADMTQPLTEQDHRYLRILRGEESAPTPYLETFAGLTEFMGVACQFAIHYACENEETFRKFAGNVARHCKRVFFGTCMDGQEVYSMLMNIPGYTFRSDKKTWGQIDKDYADGEGWTEDFGRAIKVKLESFERPVTEYLVPFQKVTEILKEFGLRLVSSDLFKDLYSKQSKVLLKDDHLKFSSVHRTFVFMRDEKVAEEKAAEVEEKKQEEVEEQKEEEKKKDLFSLRQVAKDNRSLRL